MSPSAADSSDQPRRSFPRGGPTAAEKKTLRAKLMEMRGQILRSSKDLADEALKGSGQDFSVDHMADHGSDNFEQEVSLSLLEGEQEMLDAIEFAIRRIDGAEGPPYGICLQCAETGVWPSGTPWIPTARLMALPYATLCVAHQEEQEEVEA
ncbi:MAG: TraR/DksA family transcriptional regulator [Planctomycetota bacterium]|nr:TraR/DksA family transcriptional regulator [Planctomycetota bacterium]